MNANDTIARLVVYGVEQPPGNYTNSESWLQGSGTLSVVIDAASDQPVAPLVHDVIPEAVVVPLVANQGFAKNANDLWVKIRRIGKRALL